MALRYFYSLQNLHPVLRVLEGAHALPCCQRSPATTGSSCAQCPPNSVSRPSDLAIHPIEPVLPGRLSETGSLATGVQFRGAVRACSPAAAPVRMGCSGGTMLSCLVVLSLYAIAGRCILLLADSCPRTLQHACICATLNSGHGHYELLSYSAYCCL